MRYLHSHVSRAIRSRTVGVAVRSSNHSGQQVPCEVIAAFAKSFGEISRITGNNAIITSLNMVLKAVELMELDNVRPT